MKLERAKFGLLKMRENRTRDESKVNRLVEGRVRLCTYARQCRTYKFAGDARNNPYTRWRVALPAAPVGNSNVLARRSSAEITFWV